DVAVQPVFRPAVLGNADEVRESALGGVLDAAVLAGEWGAVGAEGTALRLCVRPPHLAPAPGRAARPGRRGVRAARRRAGHGPRPRGGGGGGPPGRGGAG